MSSDPVVIRVRNLNKCYQIYETPRDRLKQFVFPRIQRFVRWEEKRYYSEFYALKNISFDLLKGETVGIVGVNGSGKSTLLQIICGTLSLTEGTVGVRGRIAALLELGSGFNPDFTGRENIYMNASILGLNKQEIDECFDDIVEFADIGQFIEQPTRMYSSGMVVRLAFAIAINVDPQILIVDEALAVGDAAFQRKCFVRIHEIQETGATILFVSHDSNAVIELCSRAIFLDRGELIYMGKPKKVVTLYQKVLFASSDKVDVVRKSIFREVCQECSAEILDAKATQSVEGNQLADKTKDEPVATFNAQLIPKSTIWYEPNGAIVENPRILTPDGRQVNMLVRNEEYIYSYTVKFLEDSFRVRFGMLIKTLRGVELGGYGKQVEDDRMEHVALGSVAHVRLRFQCALLPGVYFMNVGVMGCTSQGDTYLHRGIDVVMFEVMSEKRLAPTAIVDFKVSAAISFEADANFSTSCRADGTARR